MKILVLGPSGFIGTYYQISSNYRDISVYTSTKKKSGFIKFDILTDSIDKLIEEQQITTVIFLAAISNPDECILNKKYSRKINVIKTKSILNKLIKRNIYFIFFSTEYIFSGFKNNYSEKSVPNPVSYYGKQKYEIEKYISKSGYKNCAVLRIAKTYGNHIKDGTLFSNLLDKYKNKNIREYFIANDQKFSAIYIYDLIRVIDIFCLNSVKGTYNVGGNYKLSRYQYIKKFIKCLNLKEIKIKKTTLANFKTIDRIPLNVTMNNSKLKKKIKFNFVNLEESFENLKRET